jgi:hypothetical protein
MSSKINDLNPKNQTFNDYQKNTSTLSSKQAQGIYKDKYFADEYKPVYISSVALKFVANIVSASTLLVACFLAFMGLLGVYLGAIIGGLFCILFETMKSYTWRITAKQVLKYKRASMAAVLVLCGLHLVSLGGSCFGAWQLPRLMPKEKLEQAAVQNIDSINTSYLAQLTIIDQQIKALQDKTSSSTARRTINSLTSQRGQILEAQKLAVLEAKKENRTKSQEKKEQTAQENLERQEQIKQNQYACIIAAVFFELLFISCSLFIAYYLFRQFIDESTEPTASVHPSITELKTSINNLEQSTTAHQAPPVNRVVIKGFEQNGKSQVVDKEELDGKRLDFTRVCQFNECKKPFIHSIHNQKFCSRECRKLNHNRKQSKNA